MTHNIQSVFYDLLDQHNRIITSGSIEVDINKPIDELKRAVYSITKNNLPERFYSINLHIYPPNTTDYSGQSVSAKTRIYQLLSSSQPDDSIILVARPPPLSSSSITTMATSHLTNNITQKTHTSSTQVIVYVKWVVRAESRTVYIPCRIWYVPCTATIGQLKPLFRQRFREMTTDFDAVFVGDVFDNRSLRVIPHLAGKLLLDDAPHNEDAMTTDDGGSDQNVTDYDTVSRFVLSGRMLVMEYGQTPDSAPDKKQHSAPHLAQFNLSGLHSISRLAKVRHIYLTLLESRHKLCMVYGPPGIGKTTLIHELQHYFQFVGTAHYVSLFMSGAETIYDKLDLRRLADEHTEPTMIIVDSAQGTYDISNKYNSKFWSFINEMKTSINNRNLYMVLVAAYESDFIESLQHQVPQTIDIKFSIDTLLMDDSEFESLLMAYTAVKNHKHISKELGELISVRLGRHIGLTVTLLNYYSAIGNYTV